MTPQLQWVWALGIHLFFNLGAVGMELHFKILQQSVDIKKKMMHNIMHSRKRKGEKSAL